MDHVSQRVAFLREMISSVSSLALTEFDTDFQIISSNANHSELFSLIFSIDGAQAPNDGGEFPNLEAPAIFTNSLGISWLSDVDYRDGRPYRIYLLGPAFLDGYSITQIELRLNQEQISIPLKRHFLGILKELPILPVSRFFEYGIMLRCAITGKRLSTNDFIYPYLKPDVPEDEIRLSNGHGSYLAEQSILKLIEEGNLNYQQGWKELALSAETERYSDGDHLRQAKNTVIIFTTLCAGAAIRGGLSPDIAYYLRGEYIRRVEGAENFAKVTEINRAMFDDYVHRVYRSKNAQAVSTKIRDTCEYISLHLEEQLDIHSLASRIGYADYYFSKRFKKELGIGVREYISKKRIEQAKLLLRTTTQDIQDISDHLLFSSQSYFGDVFRKETGMTPSEYRSSAEKE